MNSFEFNTQIRKANNNKVNLINSCSEGFFVTTLINRNTIAEVVNSEIS